MLVRVVISHLIGKGSPYWITEHRVPELIPLLGSQPAGDVSHKPGGRLPLISARPAVTPATASRLRFELEVCMWMGTAGIRVIPAVHGIPAGVDMNVAKILRGWI